MHPPAPTRTHSDSVSVFYPSHVFLFCRFACLTILITPSCKSKSSTNLFSIPTCKITVLRPDCAPPRACMRVCVGACMAHDDNDWQKHLFALASCPSLSDLHLKLSALDASGFWRRNPDSTPLLSCLSLINMMHFLHQEAPEYFFCGDGCRLRSALCSLYRFFF